MVEQQQSRKAFYGSLVHSISLTELEYIEDALMGVSELGVIAFVERNVAEEAVTDKLAELDFADCELVKLASGEFLMPGLIDTHTHAPQYPNLGYGQQHELLDWLKHVTFPTEKKYEDAGYARDAYESIVQRVIDVGTTTCCYYGTLHLTTKILAEVCHRKGQRAFVGKCNMDRNSAPNYEEKSASQSVADTKEFIDYVRKELDPPPVLEGTRRPLTAESLVQPIITPRFAISCSDALLTSLAALVARDPTLPIQTHLAENPSEIEFTKSLFPFADSYTAVYDHFSLLRHNTVLAHCIHLDDDEMDLIKRRQSGISHCPTSNFNLRSGTSRIGEMLDRDIKVSLGTDVSGGFSLGILTSLRQASVASKTIAFLDRDGHYNATASAGRDESRGRPAPAEVATQIGEGTDGVSATVRSISVDNKIKLMTESGDKKSTAIVEGSPSPAPGSRSNSVEARKSGYFASRHLSMETLFYMATMGGAAVCCLEDRIGNFVVGKEFDALYVQTGQDKQRRFASRSSPAYNPSMFVEPEDDLAKLFEKFLFAGDDRNIAQVYVRGRVVGGARAAI